MQPNSSMIRASIQYVTDFAGERVFVQIPVAQWERIQAAFLDEFEPETAEEPVELIDRGGILVVRATPLRDLANITREERNRRVFELLERIGL